MDMEWPLILFLIFGSLLFLFSLGIPIAFAFLLIDIIGVYLLWGGESGLHQLVLNMFDSVSLFTLIPIPMFILMGEIMFRTGIGLQVFEALGKWLGRLPGRLSLLAVGSGTLFSVLTGSSVASTALLGSLLVPEMKQRRYSHEMSIGPILGSAGLATMIPPTALGVLLASLAGVPVGQFLVAIIVPGLMLSFIFVVYIVMRCWLQPSLAPSYEVETVSLREKWRDTVRYILPLGFVVFVVIGVIILGIATPTQSAVFGVLGTMLLALFYRKLSWSLLLESLKGTVHITVMILTIIVASTSFSQILSFTGVTQGLIQYVTSLNLEPITLLIVIQLVLLILGCFMEPVSIMMMTLPVLMPIAQAMQFNPIWFCVILLLNMQLATMTPPFGMDLFAMKGVVGEGVRMDEIYRAAVPFILLNIVVLCLLIFFPSLSLWLPEVMS